MQYTDFHSLSERMLIVGFQGAVCANNSQVSAFAKLQQSERDEAIQVDLFITFLPSYSCSELRIVSPIYDKIL